MGKRGQNKKKAKGTEKTLMKREKKLAAKQKKMLERIGERDIGEIINSLEQEQIRLTSVIEQACEPPSPRSNFSFVAHPHADELILFGGEIYNGKTVTVFNDMYFYDVHTQQWKKLLAPAGPVPRSGHQMLAVPTDAGGELWLFGGEHSSQSQLQFYHFRDLWVFHLATRRWEKVEAANAPSARSGHRMVLQNRQIILFGGFFDNYQKYEYYNDVHIFDLDKRQWREISPTGFIKPAPRSGCCMAAYPDGRILIWGGYTKTKLRKQVEAGRTFTDMFEIVPQINPAQPGGVEYLWRLVNPGGPKMLALNSISFTPGPNQQVYCFGGVIDVDEDDDDLYGKFTQDLVALDLPTQTWRTLKVGEKEVDTSAAAPLLPPTKGHSAAHADGYVAPAPSAHTIAMPTLFLKQSRHAPTPRMHAGICVLKDTLYIFGGMFEALDRVYTYNDFYALDLKNMSAWQVLIPNNENAHEWLASDGEDDEEKPINRMSEEEDDDEDDDSDDDEEEDGDDDEEDDTDKPTSIEKKELMEVDEVN